MQEKESQARTMGDIVQGTQLVLDVVSRPVADPPPVQQIVVGDGAGPHQLGTIPVFVGELQGQRCICDDIAHAGFQQAVREVVVFDRGEIPFLQVGEYIGSPAGCLVCRQRVVGLGIHHGKLGNEGFAVDRPFQAMLCIGDDRASGTLGPRCRNRQDNSKRQSFTNII